MDVTSYLLGKKNGGVTPTGEVEITENGVHNVAGYATANVNVPSNVQTKSATITTNGTTTITPDSGYDGISSLEVTTNVAPDMSDYYTTTLTSGTDSGTLAGSGLQKSIKRIPNDFTCSQNMAYCFSACTSLVEIPFLDTSNVTNMNWMFRNCTSLTTIPLINTSKVTQMQQMFNSCSSLTSIPLIDTSRVTFMQQMFSGCTSLTRVPQLDTSLNTNFQYMFYNCRALTTVPVLNMSSVTNSNYLSSMFGQCQNLSDDSLNNIMASLITATNYTGTKTLATVGISSAQATRCMGLSNYNDFVSAGWTTGY